MGHETLGSEPLPPWSAEEGWLDARKDKRCIAIWLSPDVVMPHVGQRVILRTVNSYDSVQQRIARLATASSGSAYFWRGEEGGVIDRVIGWWPLPKREGGGR